MLRHLGLSKALLIAATVLFIGCKSSEEAWERPVLLDDPLTISASEIGMGGRWFLSINSAGQAELHEDRGADQEPRRFTVNMAAFRRALADERFFEVGDKYGNELTLDTSRGTLVVIAGDATKVVRYYYIDPRIEHAPHSEIARAIRVWDIVREWAYGRPPPVGVLQHDADAR